MYWVMDFLSAGGWFIFISWLSFLSFNENNYIWAYECKVGIHVNVVRLDSFISLPFFFPSFFAEFLLCLATGGRLAYLQFARALHAC